MIIAGPDKQSDRLSRVDDSVVEVARLALEFGRLECAIGQQERAAMRSMWRIALSSSTMASVKAT